MGPPDGILGLSADFRACEAPHKVNLVVGAYRDSEGQPWVLPSVREAEVRMGSAPAANKEYAPIDGDAAFVKRALAFAYGAASVPLVDQRLVGVQTLSGTGACRIGGEFFARFLGKGTPIYVSDPTWGNHVGIMTEAGLEVRRYRYFERSSLGLDFEGMKADLLAAPDGSVVLLHACAHNPTGCDPTRAQWKELSNLLKGKKHHVFFDSAYQGFASGDAAADAWALREFVSDYEEQLQTNEEGGRFGSLLLAQSFAKNFGLYGERVGTLSVVCPTAQVAGTVLSQLKLIIRPMYSSPPIHGAGIVKTVLGDEELSKQYIGECASMAARIQAMRLLLVSELKEAGSALSWAHIAEQIGMFAFTGMTQEMCDALMTDHAVYLTRDGRISIAGINPGNVKYIAGAIHKVTSPSSP